MRERFQWPMPMWRAQYQLQGGHRRILGGCLIYAAALTLGVAACRRLMHEVPLRAFAEVVLNFLIAAQTFIVFLGGSNAVYRAMLRDYETKMIESHRLTPMSNVTVVLGYLFGSTIQMVSLFATTIIAGAILSIAADQSAWGWCLGNLLMLNGALTIWTLAVFSGMRLAKPISPAPILIGLSMLTMPILAVPGLGLLFGTYSVTLSIWMMNGAFSVSNLALEITALVSLGMTIFWVFVAAAKYRRPDLPALNGVRGTLLLLAWVIMATVGTLTYQKITRTSMTRFGLPGAEAAQWIVSLIGALFIAAIAVSGAVECRLLKRRGAFLRDWTDRIPDLVVVLLVAPLICLIMGVGGREIWLELVVKSGNDAFGAWSVTAASILLAMFTLRGLFTYVHAKRTGKKIAVLAMILLLWIIPPAMDFVLAQLFSELEVSFDFSWLMGCSPAGAIALAWSSSKAPPGAGLTVQAALAVLFAMLGYRSFHRTAEAVDGN